MNRSKFVGLIKKAAAMTLSMTLVFGAVSVLPAWVVKDTAIVAHAAKDKDGTQTVEANDCTFYFTFTERTGSKTICIEDADIHNEEGLVEIPSTITFEGTAYPVTTMGSYAFNNNKALKTLIVPDSVTFIMGSCLLQTSIKRIVLPDTLECIKSGFAGYSKELEVVEYTGTKITPENMGSIFSGCDKLYNKKGAICFGNWLLSYTPSKDTTSVKIAELSDNDIKIDSIADSACTYNGYINTIDLAGIKHIGKKNFSSYSRLFTVLNLDSNTTIGEGAFESTPWLGNGKVNKNGYPFEANDCTFYYQYQLANRTAVINDADVNNANGIVEIPSTILRNGDEYTVVSIGSDFMKDNKQVKTVIVPDTVKEISDNVLVNSTVEKITLPNGLEKIGESFAANCSELKYENLKYNGTKLTEVRASYFNGSPGMVNQKGALTLGNWLIKYTSPKLTPSLKISELGNDNNLIDHIANKAIFNEPFLMALDLEGVKFIGKDNFTVCPSLANITNDESVSEIGEGSFENTKWQISAQNKGLVKLGEILYYYKTDSTTINLTRGSLKGTKQVREGAFVDCPNAETLKCTSDCKLSRGCFYVDYDGNNNGDPLPEISTYKIKSIYIDDKEIKFSKNNPAMPKWVTDNYSALECTEWVKINSEAKMKAVFEQLDMPYYGLSNDKIGTLSATQEFYNMLKVHEYISTYNYDLDFNFYKTVNAFITGDNLTCGPYSELTHYLLECSGVEYRAMVSVNHVWNCTKIGDEWFEGDNGWDAQRKHSYEWLALSSSKVDDKNGDDIEHVHMYNSRTWHDFNGEVTSNIRPESKRVIGDINGDDTRDETDVELLWNYLKGKQTSINQKAADINFDGTIDVTDGVLLEGFVTRTAIDISIYPDNYPTDGMAPGFNVAFFNGSDYDNISYDYTDRDGYIVLPELKYNVPAGMRFAGWNYGSTNKIGKAGERVKISNPYTVIQPVWKGENEPDDDSSSEIEDTSSESEESSSMTDDTSSETEDSSSMTDDTSSETEDSSSMTDDTSSETEDSSSMTDNTSSETEDSSSMTDDTSSETEDSSSETDDSSETDTDGGKWLLGDVDGNNTIDIADVSMLINHINGIKSLDDEALLRADVNKSNSVDISDASIIVNHINGVKAIEGRV